MAVPRKEGHLVLDMAMSQYSYGKLEVTRLANKKLPYPGGFDQEGNLTDDPAAIEQTRRILPMGYWKGSGFAIMLDVISSLLSGGLTTAGIDKKGFGSCGSCCQVFIAIDPLKINTQEMIDHALHETVNQLRSSAPVTEDGEILCKGPNVMLGYYKDLEQTNEVLKDGYFHTGDIGEIDSEGFLKITDRKKEMFKTSGGKYISPQLLENAFKQSRFIEQIMVIGDGQKMPAAFIQPHFDYIKEWQKLHDMTPDTSFEAIANNPKVIERIQEEVNKINEKFGNWERVKRFELTPDLWTIDGGHVTPTLKLKRKVVLEKYKDLFTKIYG
jgi:long-subunit acyl-CoA synthetase (AMP-forming)